MKKCLRLFSFLTVIFYTTTTVLSATPTVPIQSVTLDVPEKYGRVVERFFPAGDVAEGVPTVVCIQDAHTNYSAQDNIKELIAYLTKAHDVETVAIEGTWEELALDEYRSFPFDDIKKTLFSDQIKKGYISGAEAAGILNEQASSLVGIEDPSLFLKNYNDYLITTSLRAEALAELVRVSDVLSEVKEKTYSPELMIFDAARSAYESGEMQFFSFITVLISHAKRSRIDLRNYMHLYQLCDVLEKAQTYGEEAIATQRETVFHAVRDVLSAKPVYDEVCAVLNARYDVFENASETEQNEFDMLLLNKAKEVGLSSDLYREFAAYVAVSRVQKNIQLAAVRCDIRAVVRDIYRAGVVTDEARRLVESEYLIDVLKRVISLTAMKDDVRYLYAHYNETVFETVCADFGVVNVNTSVITRCLAGARSFYETSDARDVALTKNALDVAREHNASLLPLVVGGYHTEGIGAELRRRNVPYCVVAPAIDDGSKTIAYDAKMSGQLYGVDAAMRHNLTFVASKIKSLGTGSAIASQYPMVSKLIMRIQNTLHNTTIDALTTKAIARCVDAELYSLGALQKIVAETTEWVAQTPGAEKVAKTSVAKVGELFENSNEKEKLLPFVRALYAAFGLSFNEADMGRLSNQELTFIISSLREFFAEENLLATHYEPAVIAAAEDGAVARVAVNEPVVKFSAPIFLFTVTFSVLLGYLTHGFSNFFIAYFSMHASLTTSKFVNELSHIFRAAFVEGVAFRDVCSVRNLLGNLSLPDWGLSFLGVKTIVPSVQILANDLDDKADTGIRRAGLYGSVFSLVSVFSVGMYWLLSSPVSVSSLPLVIGFGSVVVGQSIGTWDAFFSDCLCDGSLGIYYCGNVGFLAFLEETSVAVKEKRVQTLLNGIYSQMLQVIQSRGEQAVGGVLYGMRTGKNTFASRIAASDTPGGYRPYYYRMVNKKRDYMAKTFLRRFMSRMKYVWPVSVENFVAFKSHVRFGTNAEGPTVEATHPHKGLLSRPVRHWKLQVGAGVKNVLGVSRKEVVDNFVSHNGDFDEHFLFGKYRDLGEIRAFLNRIYGTHTTLKADSPHIAWLMDLYHTQGMWSPSLMLAFHQEVADSFEATYPSLDSLDVLAEECDEVFDYYSDKLFELKPGVTLESAKLLTFTEMNKLVEFDGRQYDKMKQELREKISRCSAVAKLISSEQLDAFVDRAILNFFKMDTYEATRMVSESSKGSFGLVVTSTTEPQKAVFYSYNQPISLGFSKKNKMVAWVSDSNTLLVKKDGEPVFESKYDLDMPFGEVAEITLDRDTGHFSLKSFSRRTGKDITRDDILHDGRYVELTDNPYIEFMHDEVCEEKDVVGGDLRSVQPILQQLHDEFADADSFNGQTANNFAEKFAALIRHKQKQNGTVTNNPIDILIIGSETSYQQGARFRLLLESAFADVFDLRVDVIDAEEIALAPADYYERIHKDSMVLSLSQSGQTFETNVVSHFFNELLPGQLFIMSSQWDTPLGQLVQKMNRDEAFSKQLFSNRTGMRRAEPKTATSLATWYLLSELFVKLCERHEAALEAFARKRWAEEKYDYGRYSRLVDRQVIAMFKKEQEDTIRVIPAILGDKTIINQGHMTAQHVLEGIKGYVMVALYLALLLLPNLFAGFPDILPHSLVYYIAQFLAHMVHGDPATIVPLLGGGVVSAVSVMLAVVGYVFDVVVLVVLHYLMMLIIRVGEGRDVRARNGKRTLVIADTPYVAQMTEYYVRALFGMSRGTASLDVHSAENTGGILHDYHRAVVRGALVDIGFSDTEPTGTNKRAQSMVINQVQGIGSKNPLFHVVSNFLAPLAWVIKGKENKNSLYAMCARVIAFSKPYGAEVHSVSNGESPDGRSEKFVTSLAAHRALPQDTRTNMYWYEHMYGSYDRYAARLAKYHTVASDVSQMNFIDLSCKMDTLGARILGFVRRGVYALLRLTIGKILARFFGYRFWSSHSGTNVATTATATSPQNMLDFLAQVKHAEKKNTSCGLAASFVVSPKPQRALELFFDVAKTDPMVKNGYDRSAREFAPREARQTPVSEKVKRGRKKTFMRQLVGFVLVTVLFFGAFFAGVAYEKRKHDEPRTTTEVETTVSYDAQVSEAQKMSEAIRLANTGETVTVASARANDVNWSGVFLRSNGSTVPVVGTQLSALSERGSSIPAFFASIVQPGVLENVHIAIPGMSTVDALGMSLYEKFISENPGKFFDGYLFKDWDGTVTNLAGEKSLLAYMHFLQSQREYLTREDLEICSFVADRDGTSRNLLDQSGMQLPDLLEWLWEGAIPRNAVYAVPADMPIDNVHALPDGVQVMVPLERAYVAEGTVSNDALSTMRIAADTHHMDKPVTKRKNGFGHKAFTAWIDWVVAVVTPVFAFVVGPLSLGILLARRLFTSIINVATKTRYHMTDKRRELQPAEFPKEIGALICDLDLLLETQPSLKTVVLDKKIQHIIDEVVAAGVCTEEKIVATISALCVTQLQPSDFPLDAGKFFEKSVVREGAIYYVGFVVADDRLFVNGNVFDENRQDMLAAQKAVWEALLSETDTYVKELATDIVSAVPASAQRTLTVVMDEREFAEFSRRVICDVDDLPVDDAASEVNGLDVVLKERAQQIENRFAALVREMHDPSVARVSVRHINMSDITEVAQIITAFEAQGISLDNVLFVKGQRWVYPEKSGSYALSSVRVLVEDQHVLRGLREWYGNAERADVHVMPLYYTTLKDIRLLGDDARALKFQLGVTLPMVVVDEDTPYIVPSFFEELSSRLTAIASVRKDSALVDGEDTDQFFSNRIEKLANLAMPKKLQKVMKQFAALNFINIAA